jgi:hypothetical protein
MPTPYGFLQGTHRVTKTGHKVEVVELIGDQVTIVWRDTSETAVIFKKDLAFMPRKGGAPHGLNAGTYRVLGEDGPPVQVVHYLSPRFVNIDLGGFVFTINPAGLGSVGGTK